MRIFPGYSALATPALATACALFPLRALTQTAPYFAQHTIYNGQDMAVLAQGDFNNDGRDDLIVRNSDSGNAYLYLSNSDGTYDAPVQMSFPTNVPIAVGDFNHDGNLDLAVGDATSQGVHIWQGHGNGTFTKVADLTSDLGARSLVTVDVNHDNCTDLVVLSTYGSSRSLQVWKSNCGSSISFTKGQYITASSGLIEPSMAVSGDFDADGNPDLAILSGGAGTSATSVQIWYDDGKGNFGHPTQATDPNGNTDALGVVADVDDNGTSDLVMTPRHTDANGGSASSPYFSVFKGNTNRTLTYETIKTPNGDCGSGGLAVADFNGDGLNDIAYTTGPCSGASAGANEVRVLSATGKGVFGSETSVYSSSYGAIELTVVKSTQGTKPDLVGTQYTSPNPGSYPPVTLYLLENGTAGSSFPGCGTTNEGVGINVCSPSGSTATSPVKFSISAAGPTPMRTVAVWVDGKKASEQLTHAFSHYSFLDQSLSLSAGTHTIGIFGTGWDGSFQKKNFTLTVGGGSACTAPSSAGINVCKPVNGSTVGSPVEVQATATVTGTFSHMEVWVDGVKKYSESNSKSLDTSLALPNGNHKFGIFAVNTAGQKWNKVVYATVGSGSGCAAPSSYGVHVCSPVNGSKVSSPVQVTATANIPGTLSRMEVWVNGVKKYSEATSKSLSTSLSLGAGTYNFGIFAVNTQGTKYVTKVQATVQ